MSHDLLGGTTPAGGRSGSPRAPTPSTSSRSCRWRREQLAGRRRVLDVGCGEGQIARLAASARAPRSSSASTRRGPRSPRRRAAAADRRTPAPAPAPLPVRRRGRSTPSSPASCSSTSTTSTRRSPRSARVLRARRPVLLLPQPPAAPDARQRLDRRPGPRPARAVLADRPVPGGGGDDRGGREGRVHPLRPPAAVALRERAGGQRAVHRADGGAGAAARLPRPGAASTARRRPSRGCSIVRARQARASTSLVCPVAEIVVITGLSGAGRSAAADVLEDLGWFVVDNLPPSLDREDGRAGVDAGQRHRPPGASSPGATTAPCSTASPRCARAGHRVTRAVPRRLRRRARAPLRDHPPQAPARRRTRRAGRGHRAGAARCSAGKRDGRPRRRHHRPQRPPAQASASSRRSTIAGSVAAADRRRELRVQARPAARRRHRVRLPLPAQPALGGGAPPADRARPGGPRLRARAARDRRRSSTTSTTCSRRCCRPTRPRAELPHDRHRLHRRPPPLGRHRRGARRPPPRPRHRRPHHPPRRQPGSGTPMAIVIAVAARRSSTRRARIVHPAGSATCVREARCTVPPSSGPARRRRHWVARRRCSASSASALASPCRARTRLVDTRGAGRSTSQIVVHAAVPARGRPRRRSSCRELVGTALRQRPSARRARSVLRARSREVDRSARRASAWSTGARRDRVGWCADG